jgi:hypothetical protein
MAVAVGVGAGPVSRAQSPVDPYGALTSSQRALLPGSAAQARAEYNDAPAAFRQAFERITARLSSLLLSDPENGEVLGSAIELIEHVEGRAVQPAAEARAVRLAVTLASGARDRLRRSREFARVDAAGGGVAFVHSEPPAVRIDLGERPLFAIVTVTPP